MCPCERTEESIQRDIVQLLLDLIIGRPNQAFTRYICCEKGLVKATSYGLLSRLPIVPIVDALAESNCCLVGFWDAVKV